MIAFTNTRVVPLGKDGLPLWVQEYTFDVGEPSRQLAEIEKLLKEQEKANSEEIRKNKS